MFASLITFLKNSPDSVFWGSAIFGCVFFLLRVLISAIGGIAEDSDAFDGGDHDGGLHQSSSFFKFIISYAAAGFFMLFGWVGLACLKQLSYSYQASLIIALLAGIVLMIITALIFKSAQLLVSTGSMFEVNKTIGLVGVVYQRIVLNGQGKIQVVVDGVTREVLAQSRDHSEIDSLKLVRVIKVLDHEVVVVQKIDS